MNISETMEILKTLLGEETLKKLITKISREYQEKITALEDVELITNAYTIAILLIGFSKKSVEIKKCKIELSENPKFEIDANCICKNYEEYINKIEEKKFELLREIV